MDRPTGSQPVTLSGPEWAVFTRSPTWETSPYAGWRHSLHNRRGRTSSDLSPSGSAARRSWRDRHRSAVAVAIQDNPDGRYRLPADGPEAMRSLRFEGERVA